MTSRLKRKLDNIGVDVQSHSSKLTENFCLIGTPLPSLDKAKDTGEFVPLWKQEVRDEQGRRRLHGAFTGGFSAGYYNSVGSKEGWTPSTFTSSRNERASKKQARPEDFMDEEDLAEMQDSKKLVDTTEETDILGGTQAELARRGGQVEKDSVASTLESILPPSKDSVGASLLKKMGWRPGQGVGPRVTYKQLRAQDGRPISEDEVVEEEANKHLYAPRDTKTIIFQKKENTFGLGYVPGQGLHDNNQGRNDPTASSGPNLSAGFGLGALNDAEDDDIDVYDRATARENRRMAYDAGETEDDERISLGGRTSVSTHKAASKNSALPAATFQDGRPIVSGFVLSEKHLIEDRWFRLPDVPKGWTADPRRVWANDPSSKQEDDQKVSHVQMPQDHPAWVKGKSADERGSMLGETPLPTAPRSVFDYLSQKDRDRLKGLASSLGSGSALPPQQPPPPTPISIPHTEPRTAQAALKGFQPFTSDPGKQLRYTVYLQSQATPSDALELKPLPGQSNEGFNKELEDYSKAAQIFKPVSGAMAGRFASASVVETLGNSHEGLHKPTKDDYARLDDRQEEAKEKETEESPKAHAAKMNMFGPMTREVKVWQPARLLCRRFGVKDPHPDGVGPTEESLPGGSAAAKPEAWQAEVKKVSGFPDFTPSQADSGIASGSSTPYFSTNRRDLANIGLGDDEEQGKETLTYERPTKDIFKAIFASDEEDSDDEADARMDDTIDEPVAPVAGPAVSADIPAPSRDTSSLPPEGQPSSEAKVDMTSFKPTFIPKSAREHRRKDQDRKEKDKKDRDKKKKGKMVVSFDVDDDGGNPGKVREKEKKERRKEKRQKKEKKQEQDEESMWIEKPPPEIVKDLVIPASTEVGDVDVDGSQHPRGRKRAVDFL